MNLDASLFEFFNGSVHFPILDSFMIYLTDSKRVLHGTIGAMVLYLIVQKGKKEAFIFVGGAVLAFAAADSIAHQVLKPFFGRVRPANPAYFMDNVNQMFAHARFLVGMNGSFSTPSNHAANMFAQAVYWSLIYPKWSKILIPVGLLIACTRIYVGVHYPFDTLLGAVFGSACGIGAYLILCKTPVKLPECRSSRSTP